MNLRPLSPPVADTRELAIIQEIQQRLAKVDAGCKSDPEGTLQQAQAALDLAKQIRDRHWRARCWNALGMGYGAKGDYEQAIAWFKKAVRYFEAVDDAEHLIRILDNLSHIQTFAEQYAYALQTGERAIELTQNAEDSQLSAEKRSELLHRSYSHIAVIYMQIGDHGRSMSYLKESMAVWKRIDPITVAKTQDQLAANYGAMDDLETAIVYGQKAIETIEPYDLPYDKGVIAGNLGSIYHAKYQKDRSADTLYEAIRLTRQSQASFRAAEARNRELMTSLNMGWMFIDLADFDQAVSCIARAIDLARDLSMNDSLARAFTGMACIFRLSEQIAEAEQYLARVEEIVRHLPQEQLKSKMSFYHEKYLVRKAQGNYEDALICYETYMELYQKKLGADQRKHAAEMKVRFEVEHAEKERAIVRKDNELLQQQSRQLQQEVELKTKRITMAGMLLGQRNEVLLKVKTAILAAAKELGEGSYRLQDIITLIDDNIDSAQSWEVFRDEFEQLHQDFIAKLSRRFSQLTGLELKVCALIRINLANKEIARLLCIGGRSVETYRYRIRKKLGLARKDNLTALLASI